MDDAALLEEYKDATFFLLVHAPSGEAKFDLNMRTRLYNARTELARRNLLNTPKYVEAVMAAHDSANKTIAGMIAASRPS